MLHSIFVILTCDSPKTVIVMLIWVNIIDEIVVSGDNNNIGSYDYVSTVSLFIYFTLKLAIFSTGFF